MYSLLEIILLSLFLYSLNLNNAAAEERKKATMLYTVSDRNNTIVKKYKHKILNESELFDSTSQDSKAIDGRSTIFIRNSKLKNPKMKTLCKNVSQQKHNMHMDFIKQLLHKPETSIVGIDPYGESSKSKEKIAISGADLVKLDNIPPLEVLHFPKNPKKHAKTLTVFKLKHEKNLPISLRDSALELSKIDNLQDTSFRGIIEDDKSQFDLSSDIITALLKKKPDDAINKINLNNTVTNIKVSSESGILKEIKNTDRFDYLIQNTDKFLIVPDDIDAMRLHDGQTQCRYYVCHLKNPTKGTKGNKLQVDCKCKLDTISSIPKTRSGKKLMFKQKPRSRLDVNKMGPMDSSSVFGDSAISFELDNKDPPI